MEFESERPSIVKSIKQRDLVNSWLRLYVRTQAMPSLAEYEPEPLGDETPDFVFYMPGRISSGDVIEFV